MLWNYWCLFFECGIIRVVVRNVQIFVIRLTVFDSDSSLCTLQFFGRKIGTILFTSLSLFKHFVKQSYLRFFAKIFNTISNLSKRTAGCLCSRCRLFVFFLMLTKFTQMSIYSRPFNCWLFWQIKNCTFILLFLPIQQYSLFLLKAVRPLTVVM